MGTAATAHHMKVLNKHLKQGHLQGVYNKFSTKNLTVPDLLNSKVEAFNASNGNQGKGGNTKGGNGRGSGGTGGGGGRGSGGANTPVTHDDAQCIFCGLRHKFTHPTGGVYQDATTIRTGGHCDLLKKEMARVGITELRR